MVQIKEAGQPVVIIGGVVIQAPKWTNAQGICVDQGGIWGLSCILLLEMCMHGAFPNAKNTMNLDFPMLS